MNLAVLAQAAVLAALVLAVPLFAPRIAGERADRRCCAPSLYFASLGLGFLFIEIFLIEKASLYLNDRTSAFALVLTGMLVFSGLGSLLADRAGAQAASRVAAGLGRAAGACWRCVGAPALPAGDARPALAARAGSCSCFVVAPVSVALGLPFPLGLARAGASSGALLPWAWALNGAFSVVATPLANLIAVQSGFDRLLVLAAVLYVIVLRRLPSFQKVDRSGSLHPRTDTRGPSWPPRSPAPFAARARRARPWTREAYEEAMRTSGRPIDITDAQFQAIQARKPAAMRRIESYLKERLGSADPAVMKAFQEVPREYFHYFYPEHRSQGGDAYEDDPKPWALGYGSALSDYLGQAYMTQVCKPQARTT